MFGNVDSDCVLAVADHRSSEVILMDRPRIKTGCLTTIATLCVIVVSGCMAGSSTATKKPAKPAKPVAVNSIEATAFAACQSRDAIAADKLDALAAKIEADEIEYDGPLQDAVVAINEESANNSDAVKLAKLLAQKLQGGEKFDKTTAAKAIRELAAGRRRASK